MEKDDTFEILLKEIDAAQEKLRSLGGPLALGDSRSIGVESAILSQEAELLGTKPVDGLVQDDQIRYFLAVGMVENFNKDLRTLKEINQHSLNQSNKDLAAEKRETQQMTSIIEGIGQEIGEKAVGEKEGDQPSKVSLDKKVELTANTRMNKKILRDFKKKLRSFLDDTESLSPDYSDSHGSRVGILLQALWTNYIDNGIHDYVSIESLEFDVEKEDIEHVKRAGIVHQNRKNPDQIRLVDFTLQ